MEVEKFAMLCTSCKLVLNNNDDIFGTSCGHLYHFNCLKEFHGRLTNCLHCQSYKPCMFKMFLEFGEAPVPWEDQTKTIELLNVLQNANNALTTAEEKYKTSQDNVQKLEGRVKKFEDTLKLKNIDISNVENDIKILKIRNSFLENELKLLSKKICEYNGNAENHIVETIARNCSDELKSAEKSRELTEKEIFENCDSRNKSNIKSEVSTGAIPKVRYNNSNKTENPPGAESPKKDVCKAQILKNNISTIKINNYLVKLLDKYSLEKTVLFIASKLQIAISPGDITDITFVPENKKYASLTITFKEHDVKQLFLFRRNWLKKHYSTKFLKIEE